MKKLVIIAMIFMVSTVFAQSEIGFKGVGGHIGFVMPEDPIDNTIGFGLDADLGTLMPNLHLGLYVDYWQKSYEESVGSFVSGSSWEVTFSMLNIGANVKYAFPTQGNIQPYAGGALGLGIASASVESKSEYGDYSSDNSESDISIGLLGGASMPVSPMMDGFIEARYMIVGDGDYLGIFAGILYKLK
jgi:opacity protein-like surface antigen